MGFQNYFGITPDKIKENCIICNIFDLPLFSKDIGNGLFFKSANIKNVSIVGLKNNFLAGDAVLYLEKTKCRTVFLFGSCGGCGDTKIGDIVAIDKTYNFESFSDMLSGASCETKYIKASPRLLSQICIQNTKIKKTNSACVSSLILEKNFLNLFENNGIEVCDMESSIVFSACRKIGIDCAALLYITDIIGESFAGLNLDVKSKNLASKARKESRRTLMQIINGAT